MKTIFPKKELHIPKWFLVDATGKTLGKLSAEVSKLLRGKEISFFTPGVDLGNYVIIINANKIEVSGKKELKKLYYRTSQRPGSLKIETFKELRNRIPTRILEKAIWGMLPKGVLGRQYYRRLYIYANNEILFDKRKFSTTENTKNQTELDISKNWIKINL
jgi:large subunit ribosomal protein L13